MKKTALFAAICLLLLSCSCGSPKYHYEVRRDLGVYFTNADIVIETVRSALVSNSSKITLTFRVDNDCMDDIPATVKELMTFAMSETGDPREGDYLYHRYGGYELEYSREGEDHTVCIMPTYYTDTKQEEYVNERVAEILGELSVSDMSDADKIRAVYDYVYESVNYDVVHKKNEHYHLKTTAYAALKNGCAVCGGYAGLMYRLLREAGIKARIITGYADGEYHAWNIAELDGLWYNIDVTWDKLTGTHDNYLKSDVAFSDTHIRDETFRTSEFYSVYPMSQKDFEYEREEL
jgi:transglutaminase-like putative cysteine protease